MAELVRLQLQNSYDYSTSDIIRSYTHRGDVENHLRLGNEYQTSSPSSGQDSLNVRIHFKTDDMGASSLSWALTNQVLYWPAYDKDDRRITYSNGNCYLSLDNGYKELITGVFRYAITTGETALANSNFTWTSFSDEATINAALDANGCVIKNQIIQIVPVDNEYANLSGSCEVLLQPNTDYYLWLYGVQNVTSYFRIFMITGYWSPPLLTVETSGAANCTITYDANGGTGAPTTETVMMSQLYTISNIQPTRPGYAFLYWIINGNANHKYYPGDTVVPYGDLTITAVWGQNYTVTYNGNGNTGGSVANTSHAYGISSSLANNTFTKSHTISFNGNGGTSAAASKIGTYSSNGWNSNANGSGTSYYSGQSVTDLSSAGGTVTLYAQWTGGGVIVPTATREGYRFTGWNTASNGSGTNYFAGATFYPTANITLYAQWKPITGQEATIMFIKVNNKWRASNV